MTMLGDLRLFNLLRDRHSNLSMPHVLDGCGWWISCLTFLCYIWLLSTPGASTRTLLMLHMPKAISSIIASCPVTTVWKLTFAFDEKKNSNFQKFYPILLCVLDAPASYSLHIRYGICHLYKLDHVFWCCKQNIAKPLVFLFIFSFIWIILCFRAYFSYSLLRKIYAI